MHSTYSDGSTTIESMAASAVEKGLTTIAITDHMPLPFATRYAMDRSRLTAYRNDIESARQKFGNDLTILAGLEIEYIPRHMEWIREIIAMGWDMLLVSIHGIVTDHGHFMVNGREDEFTTSLDAVFKNDIREFCTHYYALIQEAAATRWFDVTGHMDVIKKHNRNNRYFDERDDWYQALIHDTLESIRTHGLRLEINTNGLNHQAGATYPSPWILRRAEAMAIPLILGSDAHSPDRQGQYFDRARDFIEDKGAHLPVFI
jgi:histidinol-phosphatase (PHP family)